MKNYELTIQQKRVKALYEREIRRIINQLSREEGLPSLPVSYCEVDRNFQVLKIYVAFLENEEGGKELLETFSKRYTSVITRILASTRKFPRIPRLVFLPDRELDKINRIEELIKNN